MARPDGAPVLRWRCRVLVCSLILAFGCTGVLQSIGARWATRKISEVFHLDEAQQEATRASVERVMASAPEVLGSRVDLLVATVDRALSRGLNEKNMLIIERQIDVLLDRTASWIIDEAAPILATLRDEQIDFAQAQLELRLQATREELDKPDAERIVDRQEKFLKAIEQWTGRLSDAQVAAIRAHVAAMPDEAGAGLRADERRLADFADGLREHPGAAAIRDLLWEAWTKREDWGPNTRSADQRRADGRKTLFFVYGLLDAEQKDHMSEHLHEVHEKVSRFLGMGGAG
ncbi:MAG: DUF6279 family lipoprotein [Polyangiales bacterium]